METKKQTAPLNILLADDDKDDCLLFKEALREVKVEKKLVTVEHGVALMDFLNQTDALPEIIFLDINMPHKNGKECLAEIRNHKLFSDIPVVMYSTSNNKADIEETYNGGANFYLVKPFLFTGLTDVLEKLPSWDWSKQKPHSPKEQFVINAEEQ